MARVLNKRTDKIPPDAVLCDRTTKLGSILQHISKSIPSFSWRLKNTRVRTGYVGMPRYLATLMYCWNLPIVRRRR